MAKHPVWRSYDPTADKAVARVYRQQKKKEENNMATWTEKAEADYRAKWPGMPCKRIAGQEAKYEGKELNPMGSVYQAYAMRGWVQEDGRNVSVLEPQDAQQYKNMAGVNGMSLEEQLQRWCKLQRWIKDDPDIGLKGLAANLGLKDPQSIRNFIEKYGAGLSRRLGKFPKLNSMKIRKGIWREVMEQ